jgi:hypothetical protein
MKKSLAAVLAMLAGLVAAGAVALATPAGATVTEPGPVCGTWNMRGTSGTYPEIAFGGAPSGSSVGTYTARLVKPTEGTAPGVEFAAKDLEITGPVTIRVGYELGGPASTAAGAVRLFGYEAEGANTITDGPDYKDEATGSEGTLTLSIPAGESVGTLGLVYDSSNDAKGSVTFSGMTAGQRPVRFTECPAATSTGSPSPSASVSTSASARPSASASASPSKSSSAAPVAGAPSLPVTGPSMGLLVGLGLMALAAGGGVLLVLRRRKLNFRA